MSKWCAPGKNHGNKLNELILPGTPHCPAGAHVALLFWDLTSSSSSQDEKFRKVSKRWGNKEKFLSAASSERRVALRLQKTSPEDTGESKDTLFTFLMVVPQEHTECQVSKLLWVLHKDSPPISPPLFPYSLISFTANYLNPSHLNKVNFYKLVQPRIVLIYLFAIL